MKKHPIRRILLGGFVIPLVVSVAVVDYLSWRDERRAVDQLVDQLQRQVGDRIQSRLVQFTEEPLRATDFLLRALRRGDLDPDRLDTWGPYLFDQGQLFESLTYLYFGNPKGDYVELVQSPHWEDQVILTEGVRPEVSVFLSSLSTTARLREAPEEFYDPRTRPWYQAAESGRSRWTEIYELIGSDLSGVPAALGLGFVRPLVAGDRQTVLGVMGADFILADLNRFLQGLSIGESGHALVLDRDGTVIASSLAQPPLGPDEQPLQVTAVEDELIRSTGRYLLKRFEGNLTRVAVRQSLSFDYEGDRQLLQVIPFGDPRGLDWLIVVGVPESDFTAGIQARARNTLLMSLGVLGLAVALSTWIANRLSHATGRLSAASTAIAQGALEQKVQGSPIRELDIVAQSFNHMSLKLQQSYAALEAYSVSLEEKVQARTAELELEVSVRREAEAAIALSEQRYRSLFEDAPISLWEEDFSEVKSYLEGLTASQDGADWVACLAQQDDVVEACIQRIQIVEVNQAALELFNLTSKEHLMARLAMTHSPQVLADFRIELIALAEGRSQFELETVALNGQGEAKQLWVQGFVVDGHGKDWSRVVISILDLTTRKQAEAAIRQAKEAAELANRAKSDFLANMSHELRSPLNAILGFARLMGRSRTLPADHGEHAAIIHRSGEHLLDLINDVLDMSKIEAGHVDVTPANVDLHRLLDDLRSMFRLQAEDKQLNFVVEASSDLPRYVYLDGGKLRQILINLLSNGIKFTQEGQVSLRMTVQPSPRKEQDLVRSSAAGSGQAAPMGRDFDLELCCQVEDTGPGVPESELEMIFAPFTQTEVGKQSQKGTGLGLPISRQFARLMGGDLHLANCISPPTQIVEGAVFTLMLPMVLVEQQVRLELEPTPRRVIALEPGQSQVRVLVVDDKLENRQLLRGLLQPLGFELRSAEDGQEAIAQTLDWQPHLIWMDLRMGGLDGLTATRCIREASSQLQTIPKIIALSASTSEEERTAAAAAGCDDFLSKPFVEAQLFELMRQQLKLRYLYDIASDEETETASQLALDASALAALSPELRQGLADATQRIDWEQLFGLIAEVRMQDTALAATLTQVVQNFDYGQLLQSLNVGEHRS